MLAGHKNSSLSRLYLTAGLLLAALIVRALIPPGYMPGNLLAGEIMAMCPVAGADTLALLQPDVGFGLNLAGQGDLHGWRLGLEHIVPIDQDLDGPQLETDEQLTIGLQKSF